MTHDDKMTAIGDYLSNGNWEERWTCPNCYKDHRKRVTVCNGCGAGLECMIERQPVPICTITALPSS